MASGKNKLTKALFWDIMRWLRPLLGPNDMCIFAPYTCTLFTSDQLEHQPLYKAIMAITWRLLCCNPINGYLQVRRHQRQNPKQ